MINNPVYVYIAGPLTAGDKTINIRRAIDAANTLRRAEPRIIPFVPHLNHLWHFAHVHDFEYWMEMDFAWLDKCDAMLRLSGESPGCEREEKYMLQLGKPVFDNLMNLLDWVEVTYD